MTKSSIQIFAFMLLVGGINFLMPREAASISAAIIALFSGAFFIFYLVKNKLHHDVLRGLLLSVAVMAVALIPILGFVIIIGFLIYNMSRAIDGLKCLLPDVIASLILYGLLFSRVLFDVQTPTVIVSLGLMYVVAAAVYCRRLTGLSSEHAFFRMSVMWLSVPFAILTVMSIISALGNLFRTVGSSISRTIITPQTVAGHMRGALKIDAYSRNVTSTITTTVTQTVPGVVTLTATAAADIAQKVKSEKTK